MTTDSHIDAMYEHAVQALAAAVLANREDPDGTHGVHGAEVDHHVRALAEGGALPAAIAAWVGGMNRADPHAHPDDIHGITAYDPRTGEQVNPDGRADADIITALRNGHEDTAEALWEAARTAGHGGNTALVVLYLAARQIDTTLEQGGEQ